MNKTYKSEIMRALHEGVTDLYDSNLIDKATMRRFDERCLTPTEPMSGQEISALRERERVSQTVFARTLGVSLNTVSQWERGERKATGAALKLLSLAKAHGLDYVR
jgi:putative transcriptional regulator